MHRSELSLAVENCVIASSWKNAESQVLDTSEVYRLLNTSSPFEFMNGVYRSQFTGDHAEKEIQTHFRQMKDHGVSFRWYVFPHSRPSELDERLRRFNPTSVTEMQGLYARTDDPQFKMPVGVTVEELSADNLDDYIETNISGWSQTGSFADNVRKNIRDDFERSQKDYQGFLARVGGKPAATGLLRIVNRAGYFYGGSTRPEFRGKGAYRGLVCYRLSVLSNQGIKLAFVLARNNTSAPICRKLGFEVVCDCRSYDFLM